MSDSFFIAHSVIVGTCRSPTCRAVHVHLVDEKDVSRANFSLACEEIEEFVENLRITRDRIVHGGPNKGLDQ